MNSVASLYVDHREIVVLCDALLQLVGKDEPPAADELARTRWQISSAIGRHMAAEDDIARRPLLDCPEPEAKEALKTYMAAHRRLRTTFAEHNARWTSAAILADWKGFGAAFAGLITAMRANMRWEEEKFYPLAARYGTRGKMLAQRRSA